MSNLYICALPLDLEIGKVREGWGRLDDDARCVYFHQTTMKNIYGNVNKRVENEKSKSQIVGSVRRDNIKLYFPMFLGHKSLRNYSNSRSNLFCIL